MADSDENFVDNVMHTLESFHISDHKASNNDPAKKGNIFGRTQGEGPRINLDSNAHYDSDPQGAGDVQNSRVEGRRRRSREGVARREGSLDRMNGERASAIDGDTGRSRSTRRRFITRDTNDDEDSSQTPAAVPVLDSTKLPQSRRQLKKRIEGETTVSPPMSLPVHVDTSPVNAGTIASSVGKAEDLQRRRQRRRELSAERRNRINGMTAPLVSPEPDMIPDVKVKPSVIGNRLGNNLNTMQYDHDTSSLSDSSDRPSSARDCATGDIQVAVVTHSEVVTAQSVSSVSQNNDESQGQTTYKLLRTTKNERERRLSWNENPSTTSRDQMSSQDDPNSAQPSDGYNVPLEVEQKNAKLIFHSSHDMNGDPSKLNCQDGGDNQRLTVNAVDSSVSGAPLSPNYKHSMQNLSPKPYSPPGRQDGEGASPTFIPWPSNRPTQSVLSPRATSPWLDGRPVSPLPQMDGEVRRSPSMGQMSRSRHGSGSTPSKSQSSEEMYSGRTKDTSMAVSSKSLDFSDHNTFKGSSSLKRTALVTDLDKAMQQMDQERLQKIFRNDSSSDHVQNEEILDHMESPDHGVMETDLDAESATPSKYRPPTKAMATDLSNMSTGSPSGKLLTSLRANYQKLQERVASHRHRTGSDSSLLERPSPKKVKEKQKTVDDSYQPQVNLDDAVKWPKSILGKLDFKQLEVFEGKMLLQYLCSSIDENHYLRMILTRHDLQVVMSQMITCLMAVDVIKELEDRDDGQFVFKTDCMYYWTHTENPVSRQNADIGKLTPMWPPNLTDQENQHGLKYTEAEHQASMVTSRHEYQEDVRKLKEEHQAVLDKLCQEYQNGLQESTEKLARLQWEVEKYKALAGIECYTREALAEAEAAGKDLVNGHLYAPDGSRIIAITVTPQSTPSNSEYHTPAITPECVTGNYHINILKENGDVMGMPPIPPEIRPTAPAPPPPPPPPPPPFMGGPPPAPPPPAPGMLGLRSNRMPNKPLINPKSPMKPLFWQRIQLHDVKNSKNKDVANMRLVWEDLQEASWLDFMEVDSLFSKQHIETNKRSNLHRRKSLQQQAAKVIEPKRAQVVGILLSSLRMEMNEIEHAILTFDTSVVNAEKLRAIYDNRGESDEIKKLKKHVDKHPDVPLDKPDQFLYDLTLIPDFPDRIYCFIFQQTFQESMSVIENKLNNLKMTADTLMTDQGIKNILGLVLAIGNYMNGGNRSRGQADGFSIEILPNLRDVKTKDNRSSLLWYIVAQYVKMYENDITSSDRITAPIPDTSDLNQARLVAFDDIEKEMKKIRKDFEAAEKCAEKVIKSKASQDCIQPFQAIMTEFFERGRRDYQEQEDNLKESREKFSEVVLFFCVKPRTGEKEVTPDHFFTLWCAFCKDFKDFWKKEQQRVIKLRIKEAQTRVRQLQEGKKVAQATQFRTRSRKPGGLKDRLASKGML